MSEIYSKASDVVAWLGVSKDNSDNAMDMLNGRIKKPTSDLVEIRAWYKIANKKRTLSALLTSEYWSRLWIVQELMFARRVTFWCGEKALDAEPCREVALEIINTFFKYSNKQSHSMAVRTATALISLSSRDVKKWAWPSLMERFGKQNCSKGQDLRTPRFPSPYK